MCELAALARRWGWQISHAFKENDTDLNFAAMRTFAGSRPLCKFGPRGFLGEVGVRRFSMVLVALLMAGGPAVADKVDPAVMAMLREWSLTSPSPSRVVSCHGFGCAFRTEIALPPGDHAQMAAIMASGSASAQAERAAIGRTEAWFERRIAPITGTAMRVARAGPLIGLAGNRGQFDCIDTTNNTNSL